MTGVNTNKIYIIEGQDRCGKTSLTNMLRSRIKNPKVVTIHSSKPPIGVDVVEWTLEYYNNLINTAQNLWSQGFDVILDRAWLGEVVYGPLYRNTKITLADLEAPLKYTSNPEAFELLVLTDDAVSIAGRADGLSISDDVDFLRLEEKYFKAAYEDTTLVNKRYVNWGDVAKYSSTMISQLIDDLMGVENVKC